MRLGRHSNFPPALLFLAGNYRLLATSVVLLQRAQLLIPLWFGFCFYVDDKLILCGVDFTSRNHYVWGKSDWRKQNDTFPVFVLRSFNLMLVIAVCVSFLTENICDVNWRKKEWNFQSLKVFFFVEEENNRSDFNRRSWFLTTFLPEPLRITWRKRLRNRFDILHLTTANRRA